MDKTNDFEFNYSASGLKERREIERIRASYIQSSSSSKLTRLKKLDAKVKTTPSTIAITIGTIGTLIFGLGFSMVLEWKMITSGTIVSIIGAVIALFAHPIYRLISKRLRKKYSKEIIELSDELLNENE